MDADAGCGDKFRNIAGGWISDDKTIGSEWYVSTKTLCVLPVDTEQDIKMVIQTIDRRLAESQQCCRLTTAYLWSDRRNQQAVAPAAGGSRQ